MSIMVHSRRMPRSLVILGLLLSSRPGAGLEAELLQPELHANLLRGASNAQQLHEEGSASVNLFNGNVNYQIALGQTYRVDSRLSYGLRVVYNSHIYDYRSTEAGELGEPLVLSNAGVGWDLSLGRLLAPNSPPNRTSQFLYVEPDGTPHTFYDSVHWDTPDVRDLDDRIQYARDGSYLRLNLTIPDTAWVAFPDGRHHRFQRVQEDWRLDRMSYTWRPDWGNAGWVAVEYSPDGLIWTISDSLGRSHRVTFAGDPTGRYPRLVSSVELAAFGGAFARWQFDYHTAVVPRPCAEQLGDPIALPFLSSVTDPGGYRQSLSYFGAEGGCEKSGLLRTAHLRTGGDLHLDYGTYSFPPFDCKGTTPTYVTSVPGVVRQELRRPDGTMLGRWEYAPSLSSPDVCKADRLTNLVTSPLEHQTDYYFAVTTQDGEGHQSWYGLPVDQQRADETGRRFLSRYYHASATTSARLVFEEWEQDEACSAAVFNCLNTNRRVKSQRVRYEDDTDAQGNLRFADRDFGDFDGYGHYRVLVESGNFGQADFLETRTNHNPSTGTYTAGGDNSSFAVWPATYAWVVGANHDWTRRHDGTSYRTSDQCFSSGVVHRERWRAATASTLAATHDVVVDYLWNDGNVVELKYFGGDVDPLPSAGELCSLDLTSKVPQYWLRREHAGGRTAAEYYLDSAGLPVSFRNVDVDVDESTGLVATSRNGESLSVDYEYDLLGRTTWEKPRPSHGGAWVRYEYREPTGGSGWDDGLRVSTVWHANGGGGEELDRREDWTDLFGLPSGEELRPPDGQASRTRFEHNALGWRTGESTAHAPGGAVHWTSYLDYDAFGRAGRIRPPDGSAHDVVLAYQGQRQVSRTVQAATYYEPAIETCWEGDVIYTTTFDRRGRPWIVRKERPLPFPGLVRETATTYDLSGHLLTQIETETIGSDLVTTTRQETWDGRNFLLMRWRSDGATQRSKREDFLAYDARGLLRHESFYEDGVHPYPGVELAYQYDLAGRLRQVLDGGDGPARIWKEYVYVDGADGEGSLGPPGQLAVARRHNYHGPNGLWDLVVEHRYEYAGSGGRLSRDTVNLTIDQPSQILPKSLSGEFTYDGLGNVTSVPYPTCQGCSPSEPSVEHVVNRAFSGRFLTNVTASLDGQTRDWVKGVEWDPTLQVGAVTHANLVVDRFEVDPLGRPRYAAAEVDSSEAACTFGCIGFTSGPMSYDGEDRLCGMGEHSYVDAPTLPAPPAALPCQAERVIDPFGQPTGDTQDPNGCSGGYLGMFYDTWERLTWTNDQTAVKTVQTPQGPVVQPDPANWRYGAHLHGDGNQLLRTIEYRFEDATWLSVEDHVYDTEGRKIGRLERTGSTEIVRHVHPMGIGESDESGAGEDESATAEGADSPLEELNMSPGFEAIDTGSPCSVSDDCYFHLDTLPPACDSSDVTTIGGTEPSLMDLLECVAASPISFRRFEACMRERGWLVYESQPHCQASLPGLLREECGDYPWFSSDPYQSACCLEQAQYDCQRVNLIDVGEIELPTAWVVGNAAAPTAAPDPCDPSSSGWLDRCEECRDEHCDDAKCFDTRQTCNAACRSAYACGRCEKTSWGAGPVWCCHQRPPSFCEEREQPQEPERPSPRDPCKHKSVLGNDRPRFDGGVIDVIDDVDPLDNVPTSPLPPDPPGTDDDPCGTPGGPRPNGGPEWDDPVSDADGGGHCEDRAEASGCPADCPSCSYSF